MSRDKGVNARGPSGRRAYLGAQYTNQPTGPAGGVVTVSDTAPANDPWNLVAVELVNSGG